MAPTAHYLLVAPPSWGHCRPQATFGLRLIKMHPHLCITMMLPEWIKSRTEQAIAEVSLTPEEQSRVRIVYWRFITQMPVERNSGESDTTQTMKIFSEWCAGCAVESIDRMLKGDDVFTPSGAKPFTLPPSVLLCDVLVWLGLRHTYTSLFETHGLGMPKTVRLCPVSEPYVRLFGPDDNSPYVKVMRDYQDARSQGVTESEAFEKTFVHSPAMFEESIGISPMYIREADTNWSARIDTHMTSISSIMDSFINDDSISVSFWPSYAAIHNMPESQQWNLEVLRAGPQLTEIPAVSVTGESAGKDPAMTFLDQALVDVGPKSVIYVCFGSNFWPPTESQTTLLCDALEKSGKRILLVQHEFAIQNVGEEIKLWAKKMKDMALLCGWVAQLEVLRHPAISTFLSHGGSNSAMEAMVTGVPLVIWPGGWDQPFIASELCRAGNAIEIVQGRTGHNIGKKTARGVYISGKDEDLKAELESIFCNLHSDEFEKIRQTAEEMQIRVKEDMASGESYRVMQRLGHLVEE